MLKISSSQFDGLAQNAVHAFYSGLGAELMTFIEHDMPEEIAPDQRVPRINHAFELCQFYGIETEADIARLSHILLAFPPDFFQQPDYQWAHDILSSGEPASDRVDRLEHILLT